MARPTPPLLMLLVICLLGSAAALQVTPGSSCASICMDAGEKDAFDPAASTTNSSDITCQDADFSSTDKGKKFQDCLECLQKSKKVDDDEQESDLHWYLYNLRYSMTTCLYSIPKASSETQPNSPCVLGWACGNIKDALIADKLDPKNMDTYEYCSANGSSFTQPNSCVKCFQESSNQKYLANFMIALQVGCQQKPKQGELLSLTGSPFTTSAINATEEEEDIRSRPEGAGSATLTTGAIVGIAIGAGLLLFGALALFFIYWRRQRKLDKYEKESYRGSQAGTPDPILPPGGTQMSSSLRTYSAQSSYGGKGSGNMTSGDYYDKLEEDIRAGNLGYGHDPRASSRPGPGGIPAHQAYVPRAPSNLHNEANAAGARTLHNSTMSRHTRSHTTGSVALQTSDFNTRGSVAAPPPTKAAGFIPPPPPRPPPGKGHSKTPSLTLPLASKLKLPKQYTPPTVSIRDIQPQEDESDIHISAPIMGESGVIGLGLSHHPPRGNEHASPGDVSMRSGKSTLYGI